ncbi:MAG: thiamine pyrophosphate-dependent enzyme [Candidatus Omnitrophica bacterium]|nr:thiamine pyrophosphate-dependent enzyme [Candidatus Omnitrophota bacterium]
MSKNFLHPKSLRKVATHYCPGCGHGILHRIIAEVIDELGIREKTIGIAPVGCAVIAYEYWDFDCCEAPHGRGLAVATGIKRCLPQNVVFTYQGDGDLASIGIAETIHTANRAEAISCIFVNNSCYGMTGGQLAPTTLIGQKTQTTPWGRDPNKGDGWPLKLTEILATLEGVCFAARTSLAGPKEILNTFNQIKKAFLAQIEKKKFSIVEVLSPCPTVWQKEPIKAFEFIQNQMIKTFPVGIIKEL